MSDGEQVYTGKGLRSYNDDEAQIIKRYEGRVTNTLDLKKAAGRSFYAALCLQILEQGAESNREAVREIEALESARDKAEADAERAQRQNREFDRTLRHCRVAMESAIQRLDRLGRGQEHAVATAYEEHTQAQPLRSDVELGGVLELVRACFHQSREPWGYDLHDNGGTVEALRSNAP